MPPAPKAKPLAWTVQDVARELQCSPNHVRNLVNRGLLKHFKVGRLLRFRQQDIEEWMARRVH